MKRRCLEELAVFETEEKDYIELNLIRDLYIEKTSDIVYLTDSEKLYGFVCLGDLLYRMQDGVVKITRKYTMLDDFKDEEAREIFAQRNNIQKIPVLDTAGQLRGDYSRWDDSERPWVQWLLKQAVWSKLKKYLKEKQFHELYMVAPVPNKEWIKTDFIEKASLMRIPIQVLHKNQLRDLLLLRYKTLIVSVDEDEWRGIECIDGLDYEKSSEFLEWTTVSRLYEKLNQFDKQERFDHYSISSEGTKSGNLLKQLEEKGVKILLFYNDPYYLTNYIKKFVKRNTEVSHAYAIQSGEFWPVDTEMGKCFFAELLEKEDYLNGRAQKEILYGHKMHMTCGEYESRYYNVKDGKRKTCNQPSVYYRKIYLFGACLIMGAYQEDQYTIGSWLQKKLCDENYFYCVENCGSYENIFEVMQKIDFQKGDAAVIWTGSNRYEDMDCIELKQIYEKNDVPAEWCLNTANHMNHKMSELVADEIFKKIKDSLKKDIDYEDSQCESIKFRVDDYADLFGNYIISAYISRYFGKRQSSLGKTGCLVADLNIDYSLLSAAIDRILPDVVQLIIFIPSRVKKTRYSFNEYISLLGREYRHESKILIVPGDGFVPYANYFPSYYMGGVLAESQARMDAQIFAQCIAKPLHISCRYALAGDGEKNDVYHKVLETVLPKFGVEFVECQTIL